jgi:pimeloyl-ACP methyl ester carboxylesterase
MTVLRALSVLALAGGVATSLPFSAQAQSEQGPISINLEDIPYPHMVEYFSLNLYGKDLRMAYMDVEPPGTPNGRTVVLLHGMNFFGEYWAATIEALTAEGFRVVVPDQIGYGRSSKAILPYNFHLKASNTRKLLRSLEIEEVAVVGHSMGGMVATRFAFSYPEMTTHLVLVNMIGMTDARLSRPWRDTDEVYRSNLERSYDAIRQGQERYYVEWKPEYEKYIRIHHGWTLSPDWPRMARVRALNQQMVYHDPVVYDFPHVEAPTLVIGGEEDGPRFPELARGVADAVPDAELVLFENVGHNPHFEAPDLLHRELIRFLEER